MSYTQGAAARVPMAPRVVRMSPKPAAGVRKQVAAPQVVSTSVLPQDASHGERHVFEDHGRRKLAAPLAAQNPLLLGELPQDQEVPGRGRPYSGLEAEQEGADAPPLSARGRPGASTSTRPGRQALLGLQGGGGSVRTPARSAERTRADHLGGGTTGGMAPHMRSTALTSGCALQDSTANSTPRPGPHKTSPEFLGRGAAAVLSGEAALPPTQGVRRFSSAPRTVGAVSLQLSQEEADEAADLEMREFGLRSPGKGRAKKPDAQVVPPWANEHSEPLAPEDALGVSYGSTQHTARKNESGGQLSNGLNMGTSEEECAFQETGLPSRRRTSPTRDYTGPLSPFGTDADMPSRMVSAPASSLPAQPRLGSGGCGSSGGGTSSPRAPLTGRRGSGAGGGPSSAGLGEGLQPDVAGDQELHRLSSGLQSRTRTSASPWAETPYAVELPETQHPSSALEEVLEASGGLAVEDTRPQVAVRTLFSSRPNVEATPALEVATPRGSSAAVEDAPAGGRKVRRATSAGPADREKRFGLQAAPTGGRSAALGGSSWAQATGRSVGSLTLPTAVALSPRQARKPAVPALALGTSASSSTSQPLVVPRMQPRALSADRPRSLVAGVGIRSPSAGARAAKETRPASLGQGGAGSAAAPAGAAATVWTPRVPRPSLGATASSVESRRPWDDTKSLAGTGKHHQSSRHISRQEQACCTERISALRTELQSLMARHEKSSTVASQMVSGSLTDR
mmetsp:Transcript_23470/g.79553  ORF Transcript_23470/g.79553 Transcript_23470/m.79553 type:complete len:738 (+) Transcript_23470:66-2279(+)